LFLEEDTDALAREWANRSETMAVLVGDCDGEQKRSYRSLSL
jgi:hypothetical protein